MIELQTVFYGLCGLLVTLFITHPSFYIKYARSVLLFAWLQSVLLLFATFVILQVADDTGLYEENVFVFIKQFVMPLLGDRGQFIMYMVWSLVLEENLRFLAKSLNKHNSEI